MFINSIIAGSIIAGIFIPIYLLVLYFYIRYVLKELDHDIEIVPKDFENIDLSIKDKK